MEVWETGGDFRERMAADPEVTAILPPEKLAGCFSYEHLHARVDAIFSRIELDE
jgi:hypothetical protein